MPEQPIETIQAEVALVDAMVTRFVNSEHGQPDNEDKLYWHNTATEVVAEQLLDEIVQSISNRILSGEISTMQEIQHAQRMLVSITFRAMLYTGYQLAKNGVELTPCNCPRFNPADPEAVAKRDKYISEVQSGERQLGDYL
jgi:hypothetical protein